MIHSAAPAYTLAQIRALTRLEKKHGTRYAYDLAVACNACGAAIAVACTPKATKKVEPIGARVERDVPKVEGPPIVCIGRRLRSLLAGRR